MKSCLCICFILISGMIFSQKKESIKMTRSQLSKVNLFSDFVKIQAKNKYMISFEVVAKSHEKLVSTKGIGKDSLSGFVKSILTTADIGSKIFFEILIDHKKPKTDKTNIQSLEILVTE